MIEDLKEEQVRKERSILTQVENLQHELKQMNQKYEVTRQSYANLQEDIKNLSSINQNQRKDLKDHIQNLQLIDELRAKVSSFETVISIQAQSSYHEKQDAKSSQEKIEKLKGQVEMLLSKENASRREIQSLKDELEILKDDVHTNRALNTQRELAQMEFLEEDFGAFDLSQKMDVSSYTVVNSMRYT